MLGVRLAISTWLSAGRYPGVVQAGANELEFLRQLSTVERSIGAVLVTLLLGTVVLGLLHSRGRRAAITARRSPVISIAIGFPASLALGALLFVGLLIVDSGVGTFFGVPLVAVAISLLVVCRAIGYVAIGAFVLRRVDRENPWLWLLAGSVVAGIAAIDPLVGALVDGVAIVTGVGAGARTALGGGVSPLGEERTVPPANKI